METLGAAYFHYMARIEIFKNIKKHRLEKATAPEDKH